MIDGSYVLPIRAAVVDESTAELTAYLRDLGRLLEVIVVDGSAAAVYAAHDRAWAGLVAQHCAPEPGLAFANGKVNGVVTGVRRATHERIVIADDDVRYDEQGLRRVLALLEEYDVVRPQNFFDPLPWHAKWDTARTLLNRVAGRDFPGTLGVRRSALRRAHLYDGDAMFENLELIRTVVADGGREIAPLDLYVRRRPPDVTQFRSQRVRQAYDEFARPLQLIGALSVGPLVALLGRVRPRLAVAALAGPVVAAEIGRRRAGGRRVYPWVTSLFAPAWVAERAVTSWLAVAERVRFGGVRYRGGVVPLAAHSVRALRRGSTRVGMGRGAPPVPG